MSDQPTPPLGTPGGHPGGDDRTQAFPTHPPAAYPPPGYPPSGYPPSGYPPAGPPPPGAGYGGYGGYGPPPGPKKRTGAIAAIVVVIVLVVVVAGVSAILLSGGDDDEADTTTTTEDGRDEGSTESSPSSESTAPDAGEAVDRVVGSWTGTYTCAQGLTRLDLEIEAGDGPAGVTATFSFSADPSNPDVPDGSFAMSGTATEDDGLVLEPGQWIDRPGDFTAVGLAAPLPSDPDHLAGTIEGASACTTFELDLA